MSLTVPICSMDDYLLMSDFVEVNDVIACFLKNQPWFTLMAYLAKSLIYVKINIHVCK